MQATHTVVCSEDFLATIATFVDEIGSHDGNSVPVRATKEQIERLRPHKDRVRIAEKDRERLVFYSPLPHPTVIDCVDALGLSWICRESMDEIRVRYPNVTITTLEKAADAVEASHIDTRVTEITREQFIEALEELPPSGWVRQQGQESFKSSEHLSGRVTSIYVRIGQLYYTFNDVCSTRHTEALMKVERAIEEGRVNALARADETY